MSSKIRIASASLAAVLLAGLAPASAPASPLLSGYGGPGAGEQAIIGSTLLAGGSRGGGSAGGGGSGSGTYGAGSDRAALQSGKAAQALEGAGAGGNGRSGSASGSGAVGEGGGRGRGSARAGSGEAARDREAQSSSRAGRELLYPRSGLAADSTVLGLSGGDLVLAAVLALGLAVIGIVTVRAVRLQR